MKLAFSTKHVPADSFLSLCNKTSAYGFSGIEIFDTAAESADHTDSIFHTARQADAKRKLINRHIAIAAMTYPDNLTADTDPASLCAYVEQAVSASVPAVIVRMEEILTDCNCKGTDSSPIIKTSHTVSNRKKNPLLLN